MRAAQQAVLAAKAAARLRRDYGSARWYTARLDFWAECWPDGCQRPPWSDWKRIADALFGPGGPLKDGGDGEEA
jgi:hypothetical protein